MRQLAEQLGMLVKHGFCRCFSSGIISIANFSGAILSDELNDLSLFVFLVSA